MPSEKPTLDAEPAVEKTQDQEDHDQNQTRVNLRSKSTSKAPSGSRRARWRKFFCYFVADAYIKNMHQYAFVHAQEAYRARWDELMAPVNAWLSPWVMVFFVPLRMETGPTFFDSKTGLVVNLCCFVAYAYLYWGWNHPRDKFQLYFLVSAVAIALVPFTFLGVGPLIGILCVVPRAIFSSLLVSDLCHWAVKGIVRKETVETRVLEDEAQSEKV